MHPGMVVIHPPHVEHADFASSPYSIYYVWFKVESRPSWPRICHDDVQHSIGRVCEAVWREWSIRSPDRETMLQLLASELDILLRRSHEDQRRGSADTVVTEVCRIIDEYYRDPPSIRSIAAEVGVSRTRLYEQFVAQSGQTPADYLAQVRLRHALSLLHGSTLTLETIADHCGYHSASHLSRHVKHATGASPGRLRKEIRIS
jgi:AraC-like DNA-binding protein